MRQDMKFFNFFKKAADKYLAAGLCVLPASRQRKSPRVGKWSVFKKRLPTQTEVSAWFSNDQDGLCIVCGSVSGNLELLDFDDKAGLFDAWKSKIPQQLFEKLVIESTQSGGKHVFYRCESKVCGNIKLAQKRVDLSDEEIITHKAKEYVWHNDKKYQVSVDEDGVMYFVVTQIETRGEGGLFLCDPTEGYSLLQGSFENLPMISELERNLLLTAAWELNSHVPAEQVHAEESPKIVVENTGTRPGDEFNSRGDIGGLLHKYGWGLVSCGGGNEYWRRPGKEGKSWSASYSVDKKVFYVFSSNAQPFEAGKGYSHFGVYALLEHEGDYAEAAKELHKYGYGTPPESNDDVDLSGILNSPKKPERKYPPQGVGPTKMTEGLEEDTMPELRRPIIHGLLREGETMNLIAAPKTGKSWLACDLALAVARGEMWLNAFRCNQGRVLLIDNELHEETLQWRFTKIRKARNITLKSIDDDFYKMLLRGNIEDLHVLKNFFDKIEAGFYDMIILDAFYRFLPRGVDENDNSAIAYLYNRLDLYARELKSSFVLVHHTSKGLQSTKSVTDVGAGAGSQSRATDTHIILRPHQEDNVIVLEGESRSNPPIKPICLRWDFPVWRQEQGLDPEDLEGIKPARKEVAKKAETMSVEEFVGQYFSQQPRTRDEIILGISEEISNRRIQQLFSIAEGKGLVHRWNFGANKKVQYATVQQPPEE